MYALDKYQKLAVYSKNKNSIVIASPGSGKTTVIINRVLHLVKNLKINYKNIIVITFTRASALDMKNRYINLLHSCKNIPYFGTFHALFYRILRNYFGKINIIKNSDTCKVIQNVLKNYSYEINKEKIRYIINCISYFKKNGEKFNDLNIDEDIFKNCFFKYEEYKEENKLLDFEDIQLKCFKLLKDNKKILEKYRIKFKFILIDEFQDCDSIQMQIVKLLSCKNNSIFAVGDEDQCIYGFRGANPYYMVDFENKFEDSRKFYLKINYRNSLNIVNISTNLINNNKIRNSKKIVSYKQENNIINIINSVNELEQANKISNIIERYLKNSLYKYSDMAILYRTNSESSCLVDLFTSKKIPFKFLDHAYNFFDNAICKDILAYMKLSLDFCDKDSFLRIINKPYRYIGKDKIYTIGLNNENIDVFKLLNSFDDFPYYRKKDIEQLKRYIKRLNRYTPSKCIDYILKTLNYEYYLKDYSTQFKVSLSELEDIVLQLKESASNFEDISKFLSHINKIYEQFENKKQENINSNCVTLSTIHGVKGMEFSNVFLINCDENIIPHINSIENNIEEERRLFYVAITRAIDNLYICYSQNTKGEKMQVSRFVKECGIFDDFNNNFDLNVGDIVTHKIYGKGKIIGKEDKIIKIKFKSGMINRFKVDTLIENGLLVY